MSDFDKFLEIRKTYAAIIPEWIAEYEKTGEMRQEAYFMDWVFTPIERNVWCDIRTLGVPFFPQVPALNYFLDFACPMLKIGIECDGKAWHDAELDKARDARLSADGWMIFRIEGHECMRVIDAFAERDEFEEESPELVSKFFMETSEGVVTAIKRKYFDDVQRADNLDLVESTLFNHRSTPETYPARRPFRTSGPARASESLEGYVDSIVIRSRKVAA